MRILKRLLNVLSYSAIISYSNPLRVKIVCSGVSLNDAFAWGVLLPYKIESKQKLKQLLSQIKCSFYKLFIDLSNRTRKLSSWIFPILYRARNSTIVGFTHWHSKHESKSKVHWQHLSCESDSKQLSVFYSIWFPLLFYLALLKRRL